jgi:hypothetical protein
MSKYSSTSFNQLVRRHGLLEGIDQSDIPVAVDKQIIRHLWLLREKRPFNDEESMLIGLPNL